MSPEQYWEWYPGDAYTDVLGFDDYYTTWGGYGDEDGVERMAAHLEWLVTEAEKRGKNPGPDGDRRIYHAFGYDLVYQPTAACN